MTENETKQAKNRAVLVGLNAHCLSAEENADDTSMEELADLLETAGGVCVGTVFQNKDAPDPRTFIGEGKAAEVKELVGAMGADMVVVDNPLSPSQQRVLSEELGVQVLDRAALILDIFAQRARTREGRLQVEPGVPADFGAARYVQCLLDTRLGRGYDPEFLTALGETEESLSAQIAEENVQALCNLLIIEFPTEEIRGEAAGLLKELYAKADYTVGAAVPTGNGSEVEITVRPVDALARVNDALWERLDAFNAGYTGDTSTDEGYAAYDAAWAEDALALFREKLAEAEYLSETVCTVTVLDGPGGTIEAGRDSLDTVYGALFPIWMLQET